MHIGFGAKYKESMAKHRPWEPAGEALNGLRTANIVLHFVARQLRSAAMRPLRASFRIIFARPRLISASPTGSYVTVFHALLYFFTKVGLMEGACKWSLSLKLKV